MPGIGTGCSLVLPNFQLLEQGCDLYPSVMSETKLELSCLRALVQQNKVLGPPDLMPLPSCVSFQNAKALKAKKEDGNKAFKKGNYKLAYELYTEALGIDPNNIKTNAKLYCNRGTVNSKVRDGHPAGVCHHVPHRGSDKLHISYSGKHRLPWLLGSCISEAMGSVSGFCACTTLGSVPNSQQSTPAETKLKYLGCTVWEGGEGCALALS